MTQETRRAPPRTVVIGWVNSNVKRDAVELAKGWALKHFDAPEISFYSVMPFLGGFLYEVQEGGVGSSYLRESTSAMAQGIEPAWFRVGSRAFSVALRDGRPYCILQPQEESQKLFDSGHLELQPRGRMEPVVKKGEKVLAAGVGIFVSGFLFLCGTGTFYVMAEAYSPLPRTLDLEAFPHRQWGKVDKVLPNMFVDAMHYANGKWDAVQKPIAKFADQPGAGAGSPIPSMANPIPPAPPANSVPGGPNNGLPPRTTPPIMQPNAGLPVPGQPVPSPGLRPPLPVEKPVPGGVPAPVVPPASGGQATSVAPPIPKPVVQPAATVVPPPPMVPPAPGGQSAPGVQPAPKPLVPALPPGAGQPSPVVQPVPGQPVQNVPVKPTGVTSQSGVSSNQVGQPSSVVQPPLVMQPPPVKSLSGVAPAPVTAPPAVTPAAPVVQPMGVTTPSPAPGAQVSRPILPSAVAPPAPSPSPVAAPQLRSAPVVVPPQTVAPPSAQQQPALRSAPAAALTPLPVLPAPVGVVPAVPLKDSN